MSGHKENEELPAPEWREIRGSVPAVEALIEHDRAKAKLPPGAAVTLEDVRRPWLDSSTFVGGLRVRRVTTTPRHGPDPADLPKSSRKELEAIRSRLAADNQPHGYKSIAKIAGIHASTVRRRLGKL